MAHKTLIGGTSYEITGGQTLVGGTGYNIKKGQTLIFGTGYDIEFAKPTLIEYRSIPNVEWGKLTHNGTVYKVESNTLKSFEAGIGDIVNVFCWSGGTGIGDYGSEIYLNGVSVAKGSNSNCSYDYTVVSSATIEFNYNSGKAWANITDANA